MDALLKEITASQYVALQDLDTRIEVHADHIGIAVRLSALAPQDDALHLLSFPVERLRRGQVVKLIFSGSEAVSVSCDSRLVGLVTETHPVRKMVIG
ncbi:hypothetical protein [Sphingomonas sp. SCN 67-18]|uniref:hypothetical protein n=1 Tax=uncultured Sphingomonas sp. TaxID=158754 RepID=UPI0025D38EF3|nr:hypothetical protein [Sphingomonas sp. SCN 67-18]